VPPTRRSSATPPPAASRGGGGLTDLLVVPERRSLGGERHGLARACPTHPARVGGTRAFLFPAISRHVMPTPLIPGSTAARSPRSRSPARTLRALETNKKPARCLHGRLHHWLGADQVPNHSPRVVAAKLFGCPVVAPPAGLLPTPMNAGRRPSDGRCPSTSRRPRTHLGPAPPRVGEGSILLGSAVVAGTVGLS